MAPKEKESTKVPFNAEGGRIIHTRLGVWDLYDKVDDSTPWFSWPSFQIVDELLTSLPFVLRAFKTLAFLCYKTLLVYLIASLITSLLPAITLYYSGQLLQVVQNSLESRSVDEAVLIRVLAYKCVCGTVEYLTNTAKSWARIWLSTHARSHYSEHILRAHARLDVPTLEDPSVQGQLTSIVSTYNAAWDAVHYSINTVSILLQLITQFSVLISVVRGQPDGLLLAFLSFVEPAWDFFRGRNGNKTGGIRIFP